jgi:hypothetical protein
MTDRELLELAAKAAGFTDAVWAAEQASICTVQAGKGFRPFWNPLADDGDALRLAVKLGLLVHCETCYYTSVLKDSVSITEHIGNDGSGCIYAATRRAIVRAAAEIGRNM